MTGFAEAVQVGDATVFVGAGISRAAGLPNWDELINHARKEAQVPESLKDAPLAAEYISLVRGVGWLHGEVLRALDVTATTTPVHSTLASLPVRDYWTTNYDNLVETALAGHDPKLQRVVGEGDYSAQRAASGSGSKRVTKMHGSLKHPTGTHAEWEQEPVITRADFEEYEAKHPITWSRLRATWLTNSILFLGFSFDDPNLNLLLRLSRSLPPGVDAPPHYAVFTAKDDRVEQKLQDFRIRDLKRSGVLVHEVGNHNDIEPLLSRLEVRCRPPMLFVSGSFKDNTPNARAIAENIGAQLESIEDPNFTIVSFGGDAGQVISKQYRDALRAEAYRPEKIRFYYRKAKPGAQEMIPVEHRVGMAIFTEKELDGMRSQVFPQVRSLVLIGGGDRTADEVRIAREQQIAVIPVAASGGHAKEVWEATTPAEQGLDGDHAAELWRQLNSTQLALASRAAVTLVHQSMFT